MVAPALKTRAWQKLRAFVIAEESICHLCGRPVDKALPGTHRWGGTVDHLVPRSRGGEVFARSNLALAHLRCNAAKRDGRRMKRVNSRRW